MTTSLLPGRRVRAGFWPLASVLAAFGVIGAAALIVLPIPAVWFARWLPWTLIVTMGHLGNRLGPFVLAGPLVTVLAWEAEQPAVHNRHRGRMGGRIGWALSIGALGSVLMAVLAFGRP